jgi:2-dehydro-3-deoxyphosphogluconate aldolase/(4S)-4-hydroxy-2-oxoglutarate aldolase
VTANLTPLQRVAENGVIAVVRLKQPMPAGAARALVAGGIPLIEVTLTTPGALESIAEIASTVEGSIVGAGTVPDEAAARNAIAAGARFVVSPTFDADVLRTCRKNEVLCMPGAFTPAEMLRAWHAGAQLVKVFPSSQMGPSYFRDVLAPMPFLRLVPSGGVTVSNAAEWIRAGAAAVSVGSALVNAQTVLAENAAALTEQARTLVSVVTHARRPPIGKA